MTNKEFIDKWLFVFGNNVDKNIIKKYVTSNGDHLWHLFTWGSVSCLTGDTARDAFDKLKCAEVFRFFGGYFNSIDSLTTAKKPSAKELDSSSEIDIYVVANDFSWTYVRTHEDSCGPYFCKKI